MSPAQTCAMTKRSRNVLGGAARLRSLSYPENLTDVEGSRVTPVFSFTYSHFHSLGLNRRSLVCNPHSVLNCWAYGIGRLG